MKAKDSRNYLSCSCCCWFFHLMYALSTPTTVQPIIFPLSPFILTPSLSFISLPLFLPPIYLSIFSYLHTFSVCLPISTSQYLFFVLQVVVLFSLNHIVFDLWEYHWVWRTDHKSFFQQLTLILL